MLYYILLAVGVIGLGLGAFFIARSPKFWLDLAQEVYNRFLPDILKLFKNRPKTPEEWAEWRYLSALNDSDMSPKERVRYKELKRLNREYKN